MCLSHVLFAAAPSGREVALEELTGVHSVDVTKPWQSAFLDLLVDDNILSKASYSTPKAVAYLFSLQPGSLLLIWGERLQGDKGWGGFRKLGLLCGSSGQTRI